MGKVRIGNLHTLVGRDLAIKSPKAKTTRGRLASVNAHGATYAHLELSGAFGTKTLIVTPADEITLEEV